LKVGYVRVSTEEQNTIRQEVHMKELGVEKIFIDKASGKDTARRELQEMLKFVREGDTLVVESYSRLARSTRDLLDIVETLKGKGVAFVSKKEAIDTETPAGRLMLTIFGGLYQFERECMLDRQAEGIAVAKAAGKYKGRQRIEPDALQFQMLYDRWKAGEITAVAMQRSLEMTPPTFYRRVKDYEAGKLIGGISGNTNKGKPKRKTK
jgi:DNA invertase Pin-like site-specific DNA recombinase